MNTVVFFLVPLLLTGLQQRCHWALIFQWAILSGLLLEKHLFAGC